MKARASRKDFFTSLEGESAQTILESMVADAAYNTEPTYSANTTLYPDHLIPFVDKHMQYLSQHPAVQIDHYISNLRLITRLNIQNN